LKAIKKVTVFCRNGTMAYPQPLFLPLIFWFLLLISLAIFWGLSPGWGSLHPLRLDFTGLKNVDAFQSKMEPGFSMGSICAHQIFLFPR
jgi:hypothetical protein